MELGLSFFMARGEGLIRSLIQTSIFLLFALVTVPDARGEVTGIEVWQPERGGPRLLIPVIEGTSRATWIQNYLSAFNASPDYRRLNGDRDLRLGSSSSSIEPTLPFHPSPSETPFVVLANRPGHMQGRDPFLRSVLSSLDSAGADPYVLPLGLDAALSERDLEQFHSLIVDRFPGMLAIGGGDIDPALYGAEVTGARDVVPARDRIEASLIRRYTRSERGMFYGICRGSQLCAATLGFRLNQDLPTSQPESRVAHSVGAEGARDAAHASEWHVIEVTEESRFLRPAVGRATINVNSRHHQAVLEAPNPHARVVARALDGTVEAMEFVNGRGALFQFHPEDMGTEDSERILAAMVRATRERAKENLGTCLKSAVSNLMRE